MKVFKTENLLEPITLYFEWKPYQWQIGAIPMSLKKTAYVVDKCTGAFGDF